MFIHAQKVSFYLTSYSLASPFSWAAIWPAPPPCYLSLLSHPHLDPCFLITACPMPVPYKHSSRCGGKCKASEGESGGWERGKSHDRSPGSGSTKAHLSQLLSVPSWQQSPPPTAYTPFSTRDQTFERDKFLFRPPSGWLSPTFWSF